MSSSNSNGDGDGDSSGGESSGDSSGGGPNDDQISFTFHMLIPCDCLLDIIETSDDNINMDPSENLQFYQKWLSEEVFIEEKKCTEYYEDLGYELAVFDKISAFKSFFSLQFSVYVFLFFLSLSFFFYSENKNKKR